MNKRNIPEFGGTTSKRVDIRILPSMPVVREAEATLTIANDYWTVVHDAMQGGCPSSLVFHHGSGQNLLVRPLDAHIALNEDDRINFPFGDFGTDLLIAAQRTAP